MIPIFWLHGPLTRGREKYEDFSAAVVIVGVIWMGYCAAKVVATRQQWSPWGRVMMGVCTFIALVTLNLVVSLAMLLAGGALKVIAN